MRAFIVVRAFVLSYMRDVFKPRQILNVLVGACAVCGQLRHLCGQSADSCVIFAVNQLILAGLIERNRRIS
jgi:hypothetical protein